MEFKGPNVEKIHMKDVYFRMDSNKKLANNVRWTVFTLLNVQAHIHTSTRHTRIIYRFEL